MTPYRVTIQASVQELGYGPNQLGPEEPRAISFVVMADSAVDAIEIVQEALGRLTEPEPPPDSQEGF